MVSSSKAVSDLAEDQRGSLRRFRTGLSQAGEARSDRSPADAEEPT
jgi:hypothetical protein